MDVRFPEPCERSFASPQSNERAAAPIVIAGVKIGTIQGRRAATWQAVALSEVSPRTDPHCFSVSKGISLSKWMMRQATDTPPSRPCPLARRAGIADAVHDPRAVAPSGV